jgi:hypothetical protein
VNYLLDEIEIATHLFIEGVEFWSGSAVSMASAARGNLSLLAYIVGGILGTCRVPYTEIISPKDWKGQLSYKVLRAHLHNEFGIDTSNEHEASSIGMGLWILGRL